MPLLPRGSSTPLAVSYVKGQLLLSLIMGTSAGVGIWLLGELGLLPGGQQYALVFGIWVAFTTAIRN